MQDRCFNIGSALTYNNYRSVQPPFRSTVPPNALSPRLATRPRRFGVFFPRRGRLVGVSEENSRSLPHIDESGSSRRSEIDPLCSIQHRSDTATGQAGATPRGRAEISPGMAEPGPKSVTLAVFIACWRSFVAVVSPTR